jgi:hypothetical protein
VSFWTQPINRRRLVKCNDNSDMLSRELPLHRFARRDSRSGSELPPLSPCTAPVGCQAGWSGDRITGSPPGWELHPHRRRVVRNQPSGWLLRLIPQVLSSRTRFPINESQHNGISGRDRYLNTIATRSIGRMLNRPFSVDPAGRRGFRDPQVISLVAAQGLSECFARVTRRPSRNRLVSREGETTDETIVFFEKA